MTAVTAMTDVDLLSPEFLADPYPTYASLRRTDPVHRTRFGPFILTRYADVMAAFQDDRLTRSLLASEAFRAVHAALPGCVLKDDFGRSLTQLDGEAHAALRSAVAPAFQDIDTGAVLGVASARVDAWLAAFASASRVDVHATLSRPIALAIMATVLGISARDAPAFRDAIERFLVKSLAPGATLTETIRAAEAIEAMVDRVLAEGTNGLLRALSTRVDRPALQTLVRGLISAGVEPLEALFDLGAWSLATHAPVRRALVETRADAVRELLRWRHVGRFVSRVVKQDLSIEGRALCRGDIVLLGLASALRDDEAFPAPDTFDPARPPRPSRVFGHGPATCLANRLSVACGEVVLGALATRGLELVEEPRWTSDPFLRTMRSLVVT